MKLRELLLQEQDVGDGVLAGVPGRASRPAITTMRPRTASKGMARSKLGSRWVSHQTFTPFGANCLTAASTSWVL